MRIDVHAHYFHPEYLACAERLLGPASIVPATRAPGAPLTLPQIVELMDSAGVDLQVLSVSGIQPYAAREADAVTVARLANDLYADIVRQYPGRFAAFGCVPLPHVEAAIAEAARGLDALGMVGITTGCSVAGRPLDDPAFEPFWAELDRRGAVVFLHPVGVGGPCMDKYNLPWVVGAPFEDTVAALRLVCSGLTTRYPRLRVIVPHLGGTLPFLLRRIDGSTGGGTAPRSPDIQVEGPLSTHLRRFWYDTVSHHPGALRLAVEAWGVDHLLLGSDFPFAVGDRYRHCVQYVAEAGLAPPEQAAVLGENARALLGL
ncbi:MAG TPA: amidohydrolase family protein [Chloroflexota bacterium]|jgi:predicted TIM-barrel fold metal-dependent hydrolase|nr:amidohydrolase family protein [Chloroflexota bacterium]